MIKGKCFLCNKDCPNKIDENLKKRFKNTFRCFSSDINKFILLSTEGVYPYEHMDLWKKFDEALVLEKE